jgi:hypothetical protein
MLAHSCKLGQIILIPQQTLGSEITQSTCPSHALMVSQSVLVHAIVLDNGTEPTYYKQ